MNFPDKSIVKELKQQYPKDARVVLEKMQDPYQKMPEQLQGTVLDVDDCGTIHCRWDNGSSLGVVYGEDSCHLVTTEDEIKVSLEYIQQSKIRYGRCLRCGMVETGGNRLLALSRRANVKICERCGMVEALEDAGLIEKISLKNWKIVETGWKL